MLVGGTSSSKVEMLWRLNNRYRCGIVQWDDIRLYRFPSSLIFRRVNCLLSRYLAISLSRYLAISRLASRSLLGHSFCWSACRWVDISLGWYFAGSLVLRVCMPLVRFCQSKAV